MLLFLSVALAAAPDVNLLTLEAGTVPIEQPATYGGAWSLPAMYDGVPSSGWCSAADARGPFQLTFELEQRSLLSRVEVDNTGAEESSSPGIAAKQLEVWSATLAASGPYTLVGKLNVPKNGRAAVEVPKETFARWVRVIVKSNWGNPQYTEVMELVVRGHPLEPGVRRAALGTWSLEHGPTLQLGEGGGCEVATNDAWSVKTESVNGRVTQLQWSQAGTGSSGTATVVVADDGALHGAWRGSGNSLGGAWLGRPLKAPIDCRTALEDARFRARLQAEKRGLVLRGVTFAGDEPKLDDDNELAVVRRVLASSATTRARVTVYGKAADPAADELKRCERRAQAVLRWLLAGGVAASQVEVGFGLVRTGSVVQLEPRVEVELER
ncbi:MAG: hypothetical protein JNK82_06400 [Myxococcaceae bacterium]|nr:hypothetical protein [Myxococcaceae bacterium]